MPLRTVELNGEEWWLGQAPHDSRPGQAYWQEMEHVGEWLPANVPGNVRADLLRLGRLPDLAFGMQSLSAQWVDDHSWWMVRDFSLDLARNERAHLILRGVDYVSDLFLNGQHLGRHEGMFSQQRHSITALAGTENRLAIRILGSRWLPSDRSTRRERALGRLESKLGGLPGGSQRRDTLKCQMGFGWDFAPRLRTMGIWDDVRVSVSGPVIICDLATQSELLEQAAVLTVHLELDASYSLPVQIRSTLRGETFDGPPLVFEQSVLLSEGKNHHALKLQVPQPRLWWPWDQGSPHLYSLFIEVLDGSELFDSVSQTVGLRQVEMNNSTLCLNGRRIYVRGANWVPADLLPGRVTKDDYRALLTLARQANMNLLRVWGGGLREKRDFYDLCDRLGILLWQEFPFSCAFLAQFPRSQQYLSLAGSEVAAIVRDLRNHPSVVIWCGGNEFSPRRNKPLIRVIKQVVATLDPGRPFLPASPRGGDRHNWDVWHHFEPPSTYRQDQSAFASEFGLQSPPDTELLGRFLPDDELWPPGPSWHHHGAGLQKLARYAWPHLPGAGAQNVVGKASQGLEESVAASQRAHAHALQIAIEHYRRRKDRGHGGAIVWQLNEPWPAVSWALLAYPRQPKPAYDMVRRLFSPVLISLDYPLERYRAGSHFSADVWAIHDGSEPLSGCTLEILLLDVDGTPLERELCLVDVAGDSAQVVDHVQWTLPRSGGWHVACKLALGDQILSTNQYDLSVFDDIRPTLGQRVRRWLVGLVTPS
ncbi:glycoside hydrolase family 2 TIM barrel-domain containing protein [Chloroflexota bacterium]